MLPRDVEAIVIGGSAGALDALNALLPFLPHQFPLPIALVLHLPADKPNYVPEVLAQRCSLNIREPDDKERLEPGRLYVAPPGYHLLIERRRVFSLSVDDAVNFSRPSIDVLFESAAEAYGPALVGVLLTGGNDDGARGLAAIKAAGGTTVVQSPETAAVTAMPEAGLRLSRVDRVLAPAEIGAFLRSLAHLPGQAGSTAQRNEEAK